MTKTWEEKFREDLDATKAQMDGVFTDLKGDLQRIGEETRAGLEDVREELAEQHNKRMAGITAVSEVGKTLEIMEQDDPAGKYEKIGRSVAGQRLGVEPVGYFTEQLRAQTREKDVADVQNMVDGSGKMPSSGGRSR